MRPAVTADGESVGDDGERKSGRSREMIQWGHAAAALARTMTSVPAGGWSMSLRRRPLRRRRRFHCRRRCCGFNSRAAASGHCANSCSVGPSSWPEYGAAQMSRGRVGGGADCGSMNSRQSCLIAWSTDQRTSIIAHPALSRSL